MPLTPATTDKFQKVGLPGSASTLSSPGYTIGNASVTIGATTNHPTDTLYTFAIDRAQTVNGVTSRIAGTYCEFEGIVTGAQTIGSVVLKYGTAQNYPAGSFTRVYIPVSSNRENALIDGLNQDHNGKGNHKNLTDDNGNAWLTRSQVASAVNSVQAANAATGGAPSLSAIGSDTNVDLQLIPKGTGVVKVDGSAPRQFFAQYNFIESGCVWSGNAYGSNLLASMTAGVVWIGGKRLTVAAVTSRAFTLSKDTYVDFQDNGDGTARIVYTEVANNAASPVIPNSLTEPSNIRDAIIVSGATSIAAAGSVNQGQFSAVLPIASSIAYTFTDSLGNIIFPRDPNRRILGYRQITSNFTHSSVIAQVTGLSAPVIIPPNGGNVELQFGAQYIANDAVGDMKLSLWDGVVSSGTAIGQNQGYAATVSVGYMAQLTGQATVTAGLHTFNAATAGSAGNSTLGAAAGAPAFLIVRRG